MLGAYHIREAGVCTPAHTFTFLSLCFCSSSVRRHHWGARCLTRTFHLLQQDRSNEQRTYFGKCIVWIVFISILRHVTLFFNRSWAVRNPHKINCHLSESPNSCVQNSVRLVKEYPWHVLFITLAELWPSSRWREVTMKCVNYLSHIRTRHEPLGLKALDSAFPSSPSAAKNLLTGVKLYASPLF